MRLQLFKYNVVHVPEDLAFNESKLTSFSQNQENAKVNTWLDFFLGATAHFMCQINA